MFVTEYFSTILKDKVEEAVLDQRKNSQLDRHYILEWHCLNHRSSKFLRHMKLKPMRISSMGWHMQKLQRNRIADFLLSINQLRKAQATNWLKDSSSLLGMLCKLKHSRVSKYLQSKLSLSFQNSKILLDILNKSLASLMKKCPLDKRSQLEKFRVRM